MPKLNEARFKIRAAIIVCVCVSMHSRHHVAGVTWPVGRGRGYRDLLIEGDSEGI